MKRYGMLVGFVLAIGCMVSMGAYSSWKYNTTDLNGSNGIQDRVDDLDTRLDAMGVTNATTALTPTFTTATVTGAGSFGGVLTATGGVKLPVAADVSVTNGQVVTLAYGINVLIPHLSTNTSINTVTIANGAKGQMSIIIVKTGSTNALAVAQSGNFYGPALALAAADSAVVVAADTNAWYGIGQ